MRRLEQSLLRERKMKGTSTRERRAWMMLILHYITNRLIGLDYESKE